MSPGGGAPVVVVCLTVAMVGGPDHEGVLQEAVRRERSLHPKDRVLGQSFGTEFWDRVLGQSFGAEFWDRVLGQSFGAEFWEQAEGKNWKKCLLSPVCSSLAVAWAKLLWCWPMLCWALASLGDTLCWQHIIGGTFAS